MRQLFDIFSKKKSVRMQNAEKPKIIIDYRERNSLVISELVSLGLEVEVKEMKVADYLVRGTAIERKTVSDFICSMKNHHLIKQLEEMRQYDSRLLIIEGIDEQELYNEPDFIENGAGMHPNSVRGFLLSILLNYKTPIVFTKNYEDTARFISVLSKKKPSEHPLNPGKKFLDKKEQLQYVVESFPSVGPKTARKLLKKFKTVREIINAPEHELRDAIGKKADNLLRIRDARY